MNPIHAFCACALVFVFISIGIDSFDLTINIYAGGFEAGFFYSFMESRSSTHYTHSHSMGAHARTSHALTLSHWIFSLLLCFVLFCFAFLCIARCSLLMNDFVILLPSHRVLSTHIFMFEAIEWHFMHVACDVYVNVYLFIAAEIAAAVVVIVAVAVVLADTFFDSLSVSLCY